MQDLDYEVALPLPRPLALPLPLLAAGNLTTNTY